MRDVCGKDVGPVWFYLWLTTTWPGNPHSSHPGMYLFNKGELSLMSMPWGCCLMIYHAIIPLTFYTSSFLCGADKPFQYIIIIRPCDI